MTISEDLHDARYHKSIQELSEVESQWICRCKVASLHGKEFKSERKRPNKHLQQMTLECQESLGEQSGLWQITFRQLNNLWQSSTILQLLTGTQQIDGYWHWASILSILLITFWLWSPLSLCVTWESISLSCVHWELHKLTQSQLLVMQSAIIHLAITRTVCTICENCHRIILCWA